MLSFCWCDHNLAFQIQSLAAHILAGATEAIVLLYLWSSGHILIERLPDTHPSWLVCQADALVNMRHGPLPPEPGLGVALGAAPGAATADGSGGAWAW